MDERRRGMDHETNRKRTEKTFRQLFYIVSQRYFISYPCLISIWKGAFIFVQISENYARFIEFFGAKTEKEKGTKVEKFSVPVTSLLFSFFFFRKTKTHSLGNSNIVRDCWRECACWSLVERLLCVDSYTQQEKHIKIEWNWNCFTLFFAATTAPHIS